MIKLKNNTNGNISIESIVVEKAIFEEINKDPNIKCQFVSINKNNNVNIKVKTDCAVNVVETNFAQSLERINKKLGFTFGLGTVEITSRR